jgi:preprotein translocase subunit SecF
MSDERIIRPGSAGAPPPPPAAPPTDGQPGEDLEEETFEPISDFAPPEPPDELSFEEGIEHEEAVEQAAEQAAAARHHGPFRRLYFGETHFDFVRRKKWWFSLSALVIVVGAISLATRGLNLDIEFSGGTSWIVQTSSVSVTQARNALTPLGLGGATITQLGSPPKTLQVEAKLGKGQSLTSANRSKVTNVLARIAHVDPASISIEQVGPTWGSQITNKAIEALIVFIVLVSAYISLFFEWRMAAAAILAMLHDIAVTVGIYSLSGFDVTPDTVVAFLTILGYSLYDTIVVFDRVRDNSRHLANRERMNFSDLVNLSMNQTVARSLNTSLVAILPILSVLVVGAYLLGAQTLEYFGLALLIGLLTGAYSSIFIASPLVAWMKEHEPRYRQLAERLRLRGVDRVLLSPAAVAAGALTSEVTLVPRRQSGARSSARRGREQRAAPLPEPTESAVALEEVTVPARTPTRAPRPVRTRPPAKRRRKGGRR